MSATPVPAPAAPVPAPPPVVDTFRRIPTATVTLLQRWTDAVAPPDEATLQGLFTDAKNLCAAVLSAEPTPTPADLNVLQTQVDTLQSAGEQLQGQHDYWENYAGERDADIVHL